MLEENQKKSEWAERDIGAFWTQEGKKGKYLTGYVEIEGKKIRVVMFPNRHKINEKAPDYKLYISKEKPEPLSSKEKEGGSKNEELPESLV
jgi:hypothetical protein|tara:strand:- start:572 stop:844 length:273 start_codon:yes stop_codon:yes gene_type:complete